MSYPVARLGDKSNHGGVIITANAGFISEGVKAAHVTDLHSCPIPGHGVTQIMTGSPKWTGNGQRVARGNGGGGSVTGCGAILIGGAAKTVCD
jgi:uncharacterized Zn-binding protein involved in type VI secretion